MSFLQSYELQSISIRNRRIILSGSKYKIIISVVRNLQWYRISSKHEKGGGQIQNFINQKQNWTFFIGLFPFLFFYLFFEFCRKQCVNKSINIEGKNSSSVGENICIVMLWNLYLLPLGKFETYDMTMIYRKLIILLWISFIRKISHRLIF